MEKEEPKRIMPSLPSRLSKDIGDTFTREDNTLKRTVKDYAPDRIELEIGDSKQAEFYPQAKIKRWDNETNFSIRRMREWDNPTISTAEGKVRFIDTDEEVHIYEKPDIAEDGGLEIELVLKTKPDTNRFDFSIQTKELDFFYQPEITDEEAEQSRGEGDERTLEEIKREMRPENVVGSYAVYHKTGRNNRVGGKEYKTGKAFHIYRPHVVDAGGKETWGELSIDVDTSLLTVTVPQKFLDTAQYPVIVDPTFGYTSVGGTTDYGGRIAGSPAYTYSDKSRVYKFTVSEDFVVSSMSAYIAPLSSDGVSVKCAIFSSDLSTKHYETASSDSGTTSGWKERSITSASSLASGDYYLGVMGNSGDLGGPYRNVSVAYDTGGNGSGRVAGGITNYTFPVGSSNYFTSNADTGDVTNMILSIYATYTAAASENPQVKLSGSFTSKPVKIKLSGTFVEKPMKVKVGGSWV